ncbi:MAG: RNA polymerase sigma factor [Phycisphaerales bacterium]
MTELLADADDADAVPNLRSLDALHRGSEEAFTMLIEVHGPSVERTVRRMLGFGAIGAVEDVVQDVFLAAWRGRRRLRDADAAGAWLRGIAVRRCRSWVARTSRRRRLARISPLLGAAERGDSSRTREPVVPAEADPAVRAAADELDPRLARAFAGLPQAHREILVLVQLEGLTVPEAARALGAGAGAATARLHRARTALARAYDVAGGAP